MIVESSGMMQSVKFWQHGEDYNMVRKKRDKLDGLRVIPDNSEENNKLNRLFEWPYLCDKCDIYWKATVDKGYGQCPDCGDYEGHPGEWIIWGYSANDFNFYGEPQPIGDSFGRWVSTVRSKAGCK